MKPNIIYSITIDTNQGKKVIDLGNGVNIKHIPEITLKDGEDIIILKAIIS